jgi:hypothetical protein
MKFYVKGTVQRDRSGRNYVHLIGIYQRERRGDLEAVTNDALDFLKHRLVFFCSPGAT